MAPLEDRSQISINVRGAEGVTYEYIRDYTEDINQLVDSILPDAESVTARVSSGSGNVRITLKDMKERDYTQMEVAEKISQAVQKKTKARSFVQQSSSFGGRRGGMPVTDFQVCDEASRHLLHLFQKRNPFFRKCRISRFLRQDRTAPGLPVRFQPI